MTAILNMTARNFTGKALLAMLALSGCARSEPVVVAHEPGYAPAYPAMMMLPKECLMP